MGVIAMSGAWWLRGGWPGVVGFFGWNLFGFIA